MGGREVCATGDGLAPQIPRLARRRGPTRLPLGTTHHTARVGGLDWQRGGARAGKRRGAGTQQRAVGKLDHAGCAVLASFALQLGAHIGILSFACSFDHHKICRPFPPDHHQRRNLNSPS